MLDNYECVQIMKAQGLTHEQIADVLGKHTRTVTRIVTDPGRDSQNESACILALAEQGQLPFDKEWV